MDFSIVIVSYNSRVQLPANLASLKESVGELDYEIIVVDNASIDSTKDFLARDWPEVKLVANQENLGFAKASNIGIKIAKGDNIILLNPDMKVFPETLIDLKNWLKNNDQADVVGVKLLNEEDKLVSQVRRFPTFFDQLMIILKIPHLVPSVLNRYLCAGFDYNQDRVVDSLRGSFFVLPKRTLEKYGLLDERYFLWFEEVDYCRTVKEGGGQVWYTSSVKAIDYVGQSFNRLPRLKAQKYFKDSQLTYFKKWQPGWRVWLLKLAWFFGLLLTRILKSGESKEEKEA
ncbi:MAG: glycosyltransferase family 2 protein [Patescibacteria group bacterium]|nr:MAG: glycosyltransferase family 2 protein [Patescibacteria group bacterium]